MKIKIRNNQIIIDYLSANNIKVKKSKKAKLNKAIKTELGIYYIMTKKGMGK